MPNDEVDEIAPWRCNALSSTELEYLPVNVENNTREESIDKLITLTEKNQRVLTESQMHGKSTVRRVGTDG
ncbi:hypothetical protein O9993_05935 [Vibrio lentus]|nr:hypothetical protein [Vibrio lentus]